MKRIALCLLLAGAGCASRPPPPVPAPAQWKIALSATPPAPRQLDPVPLTVQVTDKNGRQITGATVTAVLEMPDMDMGQNRVVLHQTAPPGTYAGTGRFSMPGDWQVRVQTSKGRLLQTQSFPISIGN